MSSAYLDLQSRAVALLQADAFFSDIEVIPENDGKLQARLKQIMSKIGAANSDKKFGIACIVRVAASQPVIDQKEKITEEPLVVVGLFEDPIINNGDGGSQKASLTVIPEVQRVIHWQPSTDGVGFQEARYRFVRHSPSWQRIFDQEKTWGIAGGIAHQINFKATLVLDR